MSTPNRTGSHIHEQWRPKLPSVAKRGGKRPARAAGIQTVVFGKVLERLRESRGLRKSLDAVSTDLAMIGVTISKSTLSRYEDGRVPEVQVLDGLARLFRVSREQLVDVLLSEIYGRPPIDINATAIDLLRHTARVQQALLNQEGADVALSPADARLLAEHNRELEAYTAEINDVLADVSEKASRLALLTRFAHDRRKAGATAPAEAPDSKDD